MDRCPYIISKSAGDESWDYCELTERPSGRIQMCLLMGKDTCDEWEEIKSEDGYEEYERAGVMPGNLDTEDNKGYNDKKEENDG